MLGKCAVSIDLNFGGYEARALEEAILPAPVELNVEISDREGEVFLGSYFNTQDQVIPGAYFGIFSHKN